MRSMVEGHARVIPTCRANAAGLAVVKRGRDHSHVPLHHPAGGPPPRFGEDYRTNKLASSTCVDQRNCPTGRNSTSR